MARPLKALVAPIFVIVVLFFPGTLVQGSGFVSRRHPKKMNPRPRFQPGPWKQAHATFYEGGSGTFGGACGLGYLGPV
ncbi:hypothetical protein MLD38_021593 [Melastoma candidum]|uniref:Uncharacterized protein n=1 Tax=Melastoma candidum TaxID=119954 RepID=A0ACB9QFS9_9MYRT|nr:hypothetical protein MLD38_021593 [Melastoma candidum]